MAHGAMLAPEFSRPPTGQPITRANIHHMLGEDQQALLQQEARLVALAYCSCEWPSLQTSAGTAQERSGGSSC
jgi:hypothetical protein